MCSDEEPHHEIDAKLAEAIELLHGTAPEQELAVHDQINVDWTWNELEEWAVSRVAEARAECDRLQGLADRSDGAHARELQARVKAEAAGRELAEAVERLSELLVARMEDGGLRVDEAAALAETRVAARGFAEATKE